MFLQVVSLSSVSFLLCNVGYWKPQLLFLYRTHELHLLRIFRAFTRKFIRLWDGGFVIKNDFNLYLIVITIIGQLCVPCVESFIKVAGFKKNKEYIRATPWMKPLFSTGPVLSVFFYPKQNIKKINQPFSITPVRPFLGFLKIIWVLQSVVGFKKKNSVSLGHGLFRLINSVT